MTYTTDRTSFGVSKSRDPSSSMSLTSTTSTSSVSLTTEDSASNTTVVNIANKSKKRPLSSPDASSSKQPETHLAVKSLPDEMSLYQSTRSILSKYVRLTRCSNYFKIQVYHETTWSLHHTKFGLSHHMHQLW